MDPLVDQSQSRPAPQPRAVRRVRAHASQSCSRCDGTGEIWVHCRDAGPVSVRCSCGGAAARHESFIEFCILEAIALALVTPILCATLIY